MFHLRTLLMVLIVVRLLMPPGICACKWVSPAAHLLLALVKNERQIPLQSNQETDDDHDPGCPASPLAVGMGVVPPGQPLFPPALALDPPPPLQTPLSSFSIARDQATSLCFEAPSTPLYVTVRALLL